MRKLVNYLLASSLLFAACQAPQKVEREAKDGFLEVESLVINSSQDFLTMSLRTESEILNDLRELSINSVLDETWAHFSGNKCVEITQGEELSLDTYFDDLHQENPIVTNTSYWNIVTMGSILRNNRDVSVYRLRPDIDSVYSALNENLLHDYWRGRRKSIIKFNPEKDIRTRWPLPSPMELALLVDMKEYHQDYFPNGKVRMRIYEKNQGLIELNISNEGMDAFSIPKLFNEFIEEYTNTLVGELDSRDENSEHLAGRLYSGEFFELTFKGK